jgi:hypothetical protein
MSEKQVEESAMEETKMTEVAVVLSFPDETRDLVDHHAGNGEVVARGIGSPDDAALGTTKPQAHPVYGRPSHVPSFDAGVAGAAGPAGVDPNLLPDVGRSGMIP